MIDKYTYKTINNDYEIMCREMRGGRGWSFSALIKTWYWHNLC